MDEQIALEQLDPEQARRDAVAGRVAAIIEHFVLAKYRLTEGWRPDHLQRHPELARALGKSARELAADLHKIPWPVLLNEHVEGGKAGSGGDCVTVQGAAQVDRTAIMGPVGDGKLEDIAPAGHRGERQPAPDHLAQRAEVGRDAEHLLRTAERETKAGHDLVEHEERASAVAKRPQAGEKAGSR